MHPQSNHFTINGDIKGWKEPFIYLAWQLGDSTVVDSVAIKNGKFHFSGHVGDPVRAELLSREQTTMFYLENADIVIKGNYDSLPRITVTGSQTQKTNDSLEVSLSGIEAQMEQLYGKFNTDGENKDTAKQGALEDMWAKLQKESDSVKDAFITSHPHSPVSLYQIKDMTIDGSYSRLLALFSSLDGSLQQSPMGKQLKKTLDVMSKREVGKKAMDFTQNDLQGKSVHFEEFRKGKYVLIDFWASWCGPCRAENPNVLEAYNRFRDKNFTVLGISLDTDHDKWKEAVLKDGMPWSQLCDLKGSQNEVAVKYGVEGIPFNFLVDPDGNIIAKDLRGIALQRKLGEILH
jgi:peroxiredoxin